MLLKVLSPRWGRQRTLSSLGSLLSNLRSFSIITWCYLCTAEGDYMQWFRDLSIFAQHPYQNTKNFLLASEYLHDSLITRSHRYIPQVTSAKTRRRLSHKAKFVAHPDVGDTSLENPLNNYLKMCQKLNPPCDDAGAKQMIQFAKMLNRESLGRLLHPIWFQVQMFVLMFSRQKKYPAVFKEERTVLLTYRKSFWLLQSPWISLLQGLMESHLSKLLSMTIAIPASGCYMSLLQHPRLPWPIHIPLSHLLEQRARVLKPARPKEEWRPFFQMREIVPCFLQVWCKGKPISFKADLVLGYNSIYR